MQPVWSWHRIARRRKLTAREEVTLDGINCHVSVTVDSIIQVGGYRLFLTGTGTGSAKSTCPRHTADVWMHRGFQQSYPNWSAAQQHNTPGHGTDDDNDNVCHKNIGIHISSSTHLFSIVRWEFSTMKSHKLSKPPQKKIKAKNYNSLL